MPSKDSVAEIKKIDIKLIGAFIHGDVSYLEDVLSADFQYTESSGEQLSGGDFLVAFKERDLGFNELFVKNRTLVSYHNLVVVSGDQDMVMWRNGILQPPNVAHFSRIYTRINNMWKLILHQATAIDPGYDAWFI